MANEVWRSKDSQIISHYAERLEPVEVEEDEIEGQDRPAAQAPSKAGLAVDGIDFKYANAPPTKDLLNYKNMDLEMSLWAKTQAGWLSLGVLLPQRCPPRVWSDRCIHSRALPPRRVGTRLRQPGVPPHQPLLLQHPQPEANPRCIGREADPPAPG